MNRRPFLHLTTVEMRRALHRPLVQWMIVVALLLCGFAGVVGFLTSRDPLELAKADEHPALMASWWTPGQDGFLLVAAMVLVIGAAICGASVAGAEWKAGTVTTTLTWEPQRWRLHGARTLSAAVLSFVIGFLLQVVFLASFLPAVLVNGTTEGTDATWWRALVLAMVRVSLVTALVAVLAISIATLGRNTSAALVTMAAWALVVERIVVGLRPGLGRFMIAENVGTVVPWRQLEDATFERPPIVALSSLLMYLALVVGAAAYSFARRDITASS